MHIRERCAEAAEAIRARTRIEPRAAIVLGSGLGGAVGAVDGAVAMAYEEIPHWPGATAIGHAGRLVAGTIEGVPVLVMQGRVHYYEGHPMEAVTFPARVFGVMGIKTYIATNAAGGIDLSFAPGELAVVRDHINLMGTNPLIGPNDDEWGERFPDMSFAYDREYISLLKKVAESERITLHEGVYAAFTGPSYETPAEIRMARTLGADLVGMSTVPEIIVANHMGMRAAAISCVSNYAAGVTTNKLTHVEVLAAMERVAGSLDTLLRGFMRELAAGG